MNRSRLDLCSAYQGVGSTVNTAGDASHDGFDDYMATFNDNSSGSNIGVVRVISGRSNNLLYELRGFQHNDSFGYGLGPAGDFDQDGFDDFAIGNLQKAGTALIYSGASGAVLYRFDGTEQSMNMGRSVAGPGCVNGDGFADLFVGAPYADSLGKIDNGSAYVYSGADGTLLHQVNGTFDLGFFGYELLGREISAAGDINGDGLDDILIGSSSANPNDEYHGGAAIVIGHNPFLLSSSREISVSQATQVQLDLDFPQNAATQAYQVLFSAAGPGPELFGIEIPLSRDFLLRDSYAGNYPFPAHSNLQGALDLSANANASFITPAALPSGMIGQSLWMAAITTSSPGVPTHTSSVVRFEIVQ